MLTKEASLHCVFILAVGDFFSFLFFSFVLIQKKQKIKPENQKRKNYLKAPFRSPSRSSFVLNSRTAATLLFRCFFMLFILGRSNEFLIIGHYSSLFTLHFVMLTQEASPRVAPVNEIPPLSE
jgi:hypothetical protein